MTPNEDGQKTLSDIVKGGCRPANVPPPTQPAAAPTVGTTNGGGSQSTLASAIVERNIPSSSVKTGPPHSQALPSPSTGQESPELVNQNSELPLGAQPSSEKKAPPVVGGEGEEGALVERGDKAGGVSTTPRLSNVVSGGSAGQAHHHQNNSKAVPPANQQRSQRGDYRVSCEIDVTMS